MYIYTAYNLCIHSEIPLPELMESDGHPDVIIRLGKLSHLPPETANWSNRVVGELHGKAKVLIEDGREITIEPVTGADQSKLSPNILGACMSVVLRQRGLLVLHASSIVVNNQAIAFMGGSGWGKSTLAGAFHRKGYQIITDDVMPVNLDEGYPLIIPSFPQIKLWPSAADSLGHNSKNLPPLYPNAPKLSYTFTHGFQRTAVPLKRLYVLAKGDEHQITKLTPQQAFPEVVRHSRDVDVLIAPDCVSTHLRQCASLIKTVSICRFTRKPNLMELPDLVALVEKDIEEITTSDSSKNDTLNTKVLAEVGNRE
ncbi:MAG: hypothetical protein F6K56_15670 [Moorea sp. SIO3G5]|nr:hypothetical protein [Moorena sp. SIO3G5]